MGTITITSVPELINFIDKYDLPLEKFKEIVYAFIGQTVFFVENDSKEGLIEFIKYYQNHIEKGYELPLVADI